MIIKPQGVHRKRLIQQLGLDHWHYDGEPVRSVVFLPGVDVDVWLFDWERIPGDVRSVMVRNHALKAGISEAEALAYCESIQHAIPCDHVEIVEERVQ